jgi:prevent-host-death family protein
VQVNILEAKNRLSALIKAAQAGEDVVIANRGAPAVRLVPAATPTLARADLGTARSILDWLEGHDLPSYARRSAEEIDVAVEAERRAWD